VAMGVAKRAGMRKAKVALAGLPVSIPFERFLSIFFLFFLPSVFWFG